MFIFCAEVFLGICLPYHPRESDNIFGCCCQIVDVMRAADQYVERRHPDMPFPDKGHLMEWKGWMVKKLDGREAKDFVYTIP